MPIEEDINSLLEEVSNAPVTASDEQLATIAELVTQQKVLTARIKRGTEYLKGLQDELDLIATKRLPDAMRSAGTRAFTTIDGETVELQVEIHSGIAKKNEAAAMAWLRQNGFGPIINKRLTLDVGKGSDAELAAVQAEVKRQGLAGVLTETVHANTLKAFVREQSEKGTAMPEKLFGIFRQTVAKITPREKR